MKKSSCHQFQRNCTKCNWGETMEITTALDITKKGTVNKQLHKYFLCYAVMAFFRKMGKAILLLQNLSAI